MKNLYGAGYTLEMKLSPPSRKKASVDGIPVVRNTTLASPKSTPIINGRTSSISPSLGEKDENDSASGSLLEDDNGSCVIESVVDANIHTPLVGIPESRVDSDPTHRNSVSANSRYLKWIFS